MQKEQEKEKQNFLKRIKYEWDMMEIINDSIKKTFERKDNEPTTIRQMPKLRV